MRAAPRFADESAHAVDLSVELVFRFDDGKLELTEPDDHAVGRLVEAAEAARHA